MFHSKINFYIKTSLRSILDFESSRRRNLRGQDKGKTTVQSRSYVARDAIGRQGHGDVPRRRSLPVLPSISAKRWTFRMYYRANKQPMAPEGSLVCHVGPCDPTSGSQSWQEPRVSRIIVIHQRYRWQFSVELRIMGIIATTTKPVIRPVAS